MQGVWAEGVGRLIRATYPRNLLPPYIYHSISKRSGAGEGDFKVSIRLVEVEPVVQVRGLGMRMDEMFRTLKTPVTQLINSLLNVPLQVNAEQVHLQNQHRRHKVVSLNEELVRTADPGAEPYDIKFVRFVQDAGLLDEFGLPIVQQIEFFEGDDLYDTTMNGSGDDCRKVVRPVLMERQAQLFGGRVSEEVLRRYSTQRATKDTIRSGGSTYPGNWSLDGQKGGNRGILYTGYVNPEGVKGVVALLFTVPLKENEPLCTGTYIYMKYVMYGEDNRVGISIVKDMGEDEPVGGDGAGPSGVGDGKEAGGDGAGPSGVMVVDHNNPALAMKYRVIIAIFNAPGKTMSTAQLSSLINGFGQQGRSATTRLAEQGCLIHDRANHTWTLTDKGCEVYNALM
jgi:hypothetical protein